MRCTLYRYSEVVLDTLVDIDNVTMYVKENPCKCGTFHIKPARHVGCINLVRPLNNCQTKLSTLV